MDVISFMNKDILCLKVGETFYEDNNCRKLCRCLKGKVNCRIKKCSRKEKCGRDKKGRKACVASG